jgi:hypothetical protein
MIKYEIEKGKLNFDWELYEKYVALTRKTWRGKENKVPEWKKRDEERDILHHKLVDYVIKNNEERFKGISNKNDFLTFAIKDAIEIMTDEDIYGSVEAGRKKLSTILLEVQPKYVYLPTGALLMPTVNNQLTEKEMNIILEDKPSILWFIKNEMKQFDTQIEEWKQEGKDPSTAAHRHENNNVSTIYVFFEKKLEGIFYKIKVGKERTYITPSNNLIKVDTNKFIIADLDEELSEMVDRDMSDEDVARLLDKLKKKNLNINVLKLAFPEINTQKSDLLRKLREGESNIV